jgi:hypothetical protein
VFDEFNKEIYKIKAKSSKIGEQFVIYGHLKTAATIRKLSFPLLSVYHISANEKEIGLFENHIYQINPTYHMVGINCKIKCGADPYVFSVLNKKRDIMMTHKRILNEVGECFELEIFAENFAKVGLSVAFCVDNSIRTTRKVPAFGLGN